MATLMQQRARAMRRNPTEAERAFWNLVRRDRLGLKFRRQYRLGDYIVDFVCFDARLVVEIDGSQHADSAYDRRRDASLEAMGFNVLRLWNLDVLTNPDGAVEAVLHAARTPPSRSREGRTGVPERLQARRSTPEVEQETPGRAA